MVLCFVPQSVYCIWNRSHHHRQIWPTRMKRSLALQFWRLNEEPSELILGTVDTDNPKNGIVNSRFGWKLCMLVFFYSECWLHNFVRCARRQFPFIFTQSLDADLNICVVYCIVMWRKLCSRFCLAPLLGIFLACTVSCIPSKKCQWKVRIQFGISI